MIEDAISFWTDIQRYENMLAADPKSLCFAPLSELYRKLGLLDDAISVAQKGCAQHSDYPGGFFALGAAYYDKGMKQEARQALERVVALKPDHLQALKLQGQLFVETGEIELARKVLGELVSQDPEDTESMLLLRSIGVAGKGEEPEEEIIEDIDVIEDLTEVMDEAQPPAAAGGAALAEVARALAEFEWAGAPAGAPEETAQPAQAPRPETAEPEERWDLGAAPAPEDLWAVEAAEEAEDLWAIEALEAPEAVPSAPAAQPKQAAPGGRDPLTTATLAELYVSQGFTDKAAAVYRELLGADPGNESYRLRYAELTGEQAQGEELPHGAPATAAPEAAPAPAPAQGDLEARLSQWLENIRRRRDGV